MSRLTPDSLRAARRLLPFTRKRVEVQRPLVTHYDDRGEFLKTHPCLVCYQYPTVSYDAPGGAVPLCALHEAEVICNGVEAFEVEHRVDLTTAAARYARWFNDTPQSLGF